MNNLRCFITNTNTGLKEHYKGPSYTKIDSVNGYICVDAVSNSVFFFYEHAGRPQMDQLKNFEVTYEKKI